MVEINRCWSWGYLIDHRIAFTTTSTSNDYDDNDVTSSFELSVIILEKAAPLARAYQQTIKRLLSHKFIWRWSSFDWWTHIWKSIELTKKEKKKNVFFGCKLFTHFVCDVMVKKLIWFLLKTIARLFGHENNEKWVQFILLKNMCLTKRCFMR